jgi:hypothetical protein
VIEHRAVTSRPVLTNALDEAFHKVIYEGHTHLLHFEYHGLELRAADDFISWGELSPRLTDLTLLPA